MFFAAGRAENCVQDAPRRRIITRMKLPKLENPDRYQGLYVFDFGDHADVGFTVEEVAELLDSERYKEGKVLQDPAGLS